MMTFRAAAIATSGLRRQGLSQAVSADYEQRPHYTKRSSPPGGLVKPSRPQSRNAASTDAAASMATAPSALKRDGGTRSAGPQMLNTASGRSSPGRSTGADTPHSADSSSPADTAYPRSRIWASSPSSRDTSVTVASVKPSRTGPSTPRTSGSGSHASQALPVEVACSGTGRASQLTVSTAGGATSSTYTSPDRRPTARSAASPVCAQIR